MKGTARRCAPTAPLLARRAGLPLGTLEIFADDLRPILDEIESLESALEQARQRTVDQLYQKVREPAFDSVRGLLLKAKRACFNGRSLVPSSRHRQWSVLAEACGGLAEEVLRLEHELAEARHAFEDEFEARRRRETEAICRWLEDPSFRCGLAIASPTVARESRRLFTKPLDAHGRRERRLLPTLLRYGSRAAFKLSPFSTFTTLTLAEITDLDTPAGFRASPSAGARTGEGGRARSLVRLRRHLLDRLLAMVELYEPYRRTLRVLLNDSIHPTAQGLVSHVRPSQWFVDTEAQRLAYREASTVRFDASAPIFELLERSVTDRPTYAELVDRLAESPFVADDVEPAEQSARSIVDQLLDLGWLLFEPPVPSDAGHWESLWLDHLRSRFPEPDDPRLETFLERLGRLVELENGLLRAAEPVRSVRAIDALIHELLDAGRGLADLDGIDTTHRSSSHDLYQDVWLPPPPSGPSIRLDEAHANDLCEDARPLLRYARLFDHRRELLRTLGEVCSRTSTASLPLLEVFERCRPLFSDYMQFFVHESRQAKGTLTWNPLALAELDALDRERREAEAALEASCQPTPGGDLAIDVATLSAALDRLPHASGEPVGDACLFLQPASADGSLWMLNRLKEGTGRFGSRYTPVMDEASKRAWTEGLRSRGRGFGDGGPVELLDVLAIQGDTLNVHAPQTPRVLLFPGTTSTASEDRWLTLRDLSVRVDRQGRAEIIDSGGCRLLPVHLGIGYLDYMPTLVKFLTAFGPSELGSIFPAYRLERQGEVAVRARTRIGRLVLHRRAWSFTTEAFERACGDGPDPRVFARFDRWRRDRGIADRVFIGELVSHHTAGRRYSPQYLDLRSPSFFALLRSMCVPELTKITLFEALPDPGVFSATAEAGSEPRAFELLLDELALRPPATERHATEAPSIARGVDDPDDSRDFRDLSTARWKGPGGHGNATGIAADT